MLPLDGLAISTNQLLGIPVTEKTVKITALGTKPPFASSNLVARVLLDMGTLAAIEWVLEPYVASSAHGAHMHVSLLELRV